MSWFDNLRASSSPKGFVAEGGNLLPRNTRWHDNFMNSFTKKGVKIANLPTPINKVNSLPTEDIKEDSFYLLLQDSGSYTAGIYYYDEGWHKVEGGGGGTTSIDNKSIVKNAYNELTTAVGGWKESGSAVTMADHTSLTEYPGTREEGILAFCSTPLAFPDMSSSFFVEGVLNIDGTEYPFHGEMESDGSTAVLTLNEYVPIFTKETVLALLKDDNLIAVWSQESGSVMPEGTTMVLTAYTIGGQDIYHPLDGKFLPIDNNTIKLNDDGNLIATGGGTTLIAGDGIDINEGVITTNFGGNYKLYDSDRVIDEAHFTTYSNDFYELSGVGTGLINQGGMYHIIGKAFNYDVDKIGTAEFLYTQINGTDAWCNAIYITHMYDFAVYLVEVFDGDLAGKVGVLVENNTYPLEIAADDYCTLYRTDLALKMINNDVIDIDNWTIYKNEYGQLASRMTEIDNKTIIKNGEDQIMTRLGGYEIEAQTAVFDGHMTIEEQKTSITFETHLERELEVGEEVRINFESPMMSDEGISGVVVDASGHKKLTFYSVFNDYCDIIVDYPEVSVTVKDDAPEGFVLEPGNYMLQINVVAPEISYADNRLIKIDNETIQLDAEGALQATVGADAVKSEQYEDMTLWIGTKAEYDAIPTKGSHTVYYVTDEL